MQQYLAPPRQDFALADVLASLDPERTPTIRHGVDIVDEFNVVTNAELHFIDGQVDYSYRPPDRVTGNTVEVADVRRRATIRVRGGDSTQLALARYSIWTEWLAPTGDWVRWYLGVFVSARPVADDDGRVVIRTLKLADKTFRYANRFLEEPVAVADGADPVAYVIASLGTEFGETAIAIGASEITLDRAMVFDAGTSWLAVYNALLKAAAYDDLTCDERGRPTSRPLADQVGRGAEITYGPGQAKIMPAGNVEPLLPSLPNVAQFVARAGPSLVEEGNGMRTRTNYTTGPASIAGRGGERVVMRIEVDATDQDAIDAIALTDSQRVFAGGGLRFSGQVLLNPRHSDRDIIRLDKARLGLAGEWLVTSWSYPLHPIDSEQSVLMSLTAEQRVTVGA